MEQLPQFQRKEGPVEFEEVRKVTELEQLRPISATMGEKVFGYSEEIIAEMQALLRSLNAYQIIARIDNELAGYVASAETIFPGYQFLAELLVVNNAQGKGVGTKLVNKVIEYARSHSLRGVVTETEFDNVPAQRLYEMCGFVQVENLDWQEGITYQLEF